MARNIPQLCYFTHVLLEDENCNLHEVQRLFEVVFMAEDNIILLKRRASRRLPQLTWVLMYTFINMIPRISYN